MTNFRDFVAHLTAFKVQRQQGDPKHVE